MTSSSRQGTWKTADWYLTRQGQTMTVIAGPVKFDIGSPPGGNGDWIGEIRHRVTIGRSFAISTTEVTGEQMHQFKAKFPVVAAARPTKDCPINHVTWFQAAQYCRWLSEREKIPESEMCWPPIEQIVPGMQLPANSLERSGYRLGDSGAVACRAVSSGEMTSNRHPDLLAVGHQEHQEHRKKPIRKPQSRRDPGNLISFIRFPECNPGEVSRLCSGVQETGVRRGGQARGGLELQTESIGN